MRKIRNHCISLRVYSLLSLASLFHLLGFSDDTARRASSLSLTGLLDLWILPYWIVKLLDSFKSRKLQLCTQNSAKDDPKLEGKKRTKNYRNGGISLRNRVILSCSLEVTMEGDGFEVCSFGLRNNQLKKFGNESDNIFGID